MIFPLHCLVIGSASWPMNFLLCWFLLESEVSCVEKLGGKNTVGWFNPNVWDASRLTNIISTTEMYNLLLAIWHHIYLFDLITSLLIRIMITKVNYYKKNWRLQILRHYLCGWGFSVKPCFSSELLAWFSAWVSSSQSVYVTICII
jgi:hypothetical protein